MKKSPQFDAQAVARGFNQAAETYDRVAVLQRTVADTLIQRLDLVKLQPSVILDLGAGTGYCSRLLEKRYPKAKIIALDRAHRMLCRAKKQAPWFTRQQFIGGQSEQLPLQSRSVHLVVSSLMLHWCDDLEAVFREVQRVLVPEGLFVFSTLGPDTLHELRQSWRAVDNAPHVNEFLDMHDVGDALVKAKLADPVLDIEWMSLRYPLMVMQLMKELKALGAHNNAHDRQRGLMGKQQIQIMLEHYDRYRTPDQSYPATYEVIYGHTWGSVYYLLNQQNPGVVEVPLSQLRRGRQ